MKLDFTKVLVGLNKEPLKQKDNTDHATLGYVCTEALMATYRNEEQLSAEKKVGRYKLAQKIVGEGEIELSVEEVALLKELVGKAFGPSVVGPAYELLEGGN